MGGSFATSLLAIDDGILFFSIAICKFSASASCLATAISQTCIWPGSRLEPFDSMDNFCTWKNCWQHLPNGIRPVSKMLCLHALNRFSRPAGMGVGNRLGILPGIPRCVFIATYTRRCRCRIQFFLLSGKGCIDCKNDLVCMPKFRIRPDTSAVICVCCAGVKVFSTENRSRSASVSPSM